MSKPGILLAGLVTLCLVSGCAGVAYQKAYSTDDNVNADLASPPAGGFAFGLRKSVIVIAAGSGSGADSGGASGASAASQSMTPVSIDCSGAPNHECNDKIIVVATPMTDLNAAYFAKPRSEARWLGGTTLSPKSDATDPLLIQSVAVGYNNKVANIVTGAGSGFTAGLSFGPAGAWTGLLLGAAGAAIPPHRTPDADQSALERVVCGPTSDLALPTPDPDKPRTAVKLWLPVTVEYPTVDPVEGCWHALPGAPNAKASGSNPAPSTANSGWFYRVVPTDAKPEKASPLPPVLSSKNLPKKLPPPFELAERYFADAQPKTNFPVTACRSVAVELAWWQDIKRIALETPSRDAVSQVAKTQVVAAADPNVLQLIEVSSGTTVTLLSCGGFASPGTPSTAVSDDINAVIKQAQAIKAAQTPAAGKK